MSEAAQLSEFRAEVREWLRQNFPPSLQHRNPGMEAENEAALGEDLHVWRERLAAQGWGAPTWPREYGGAGLSHPEARVINEEMTRIGAFNPIPMMAGMGVTMVGPTVLEYGTEDQKRRHLPGIASGAVRWCLGLSEPNAGSDLASLTTKAEDKGDTFVINGQKIWTSGANISQWCGALVRTDPKAAKRDGISFVMLPMDQPGVETRPIKLIAGASPFCETFFNNAVADKTDLLGKLNDGWSVVKRLLQHERQSQTGQRGAVGGPKPTPIQELAKRYVGSNDDGTLADADLRSRLVNHLMDAKAHGLTISRITAEARGKVQVSAAASILKNSATRVAQTKAELALEIMGGQGLGWEGEAFTSEELASVREWLAGKAMSIYGGSYEVQNNIISKNILGLPETTQKG
ncbi:MAG: acyl-CoA dehydrogenase family protein [Pseudomonadales bacterium]